MSKQITITIHVDPSSAIRAGHSECGDVRVTLSDTDLASLTPELRDVLARHVAGERVGHDAGYAAPLHRGAPVPVVDASIETIAMLLDARAVHVASTRAKMEADARAERELADARVIAAIDRAPVMYSRGMRADGMWSYWDREMLISVDVPRVPEGLPIDICSPEVRARAEGAIAALETRVESVRLAALPRLAAEVAARAALETRVQAEYDALYARLPQSMRDRAADGYATDAEITVAIARIIRDDAGYGGYAGWAAREDLEALTDAEHASLVEIRAGAPDGATVTPCIVGEKKWRSAVDDDDREADGYDSSDDTVRVPDADRDLRRVAIIEWTRAGIATMAVIPL